MHIVVLLAFIFTMSSFLCKSVRSFGMQRCSMLKFTALPTKSFARTAFSTGGEDTTIATCTRKITELLNPVRVRVTSTNDDPNGSHVMPLYLTISWHRADTPLLNSDPG